MKILTSVPLNHAQEAVLDDFQKFEIGPTLRKPCHDPKYVTVTIKTFQQQVIRFSISPNGILDDLELVDEIDKV